MLGYDIAFADYGTPYLFRKRVFKSAMHVFGEGIQVEERGGYAVKSILEKIDSFKDQLFCPKEVIASAILLQLWQWVTSEKVKFDDPKIELLLEFGALIAKQGRRTFFEMVPFHSYLPTEVNRNIKRAKEITSSVILPVFQSHLESYTPSVIRDMTDSFIN